MPNVYSKERTLEHYRQLGAARALVLRQQPGGLPTGVLGATEQESCRAILEAWWLAEGAPAAPNALFEGTEAEWREDEEANGFPAFHGSRRDFRKACQRHFRTAMNARWGTFSFSFYVAAGWFTEAVFQGIDVVAQRRREEDAAAAAAGTPSAKRFRGSGGASQPATDLPPIT